MGYYYDPEKYNSRFYNSKFRNVLLKSKPVLSVDPKFETCDGHILWERDQDRLWIYRNNLWINMEELEE